MEQKIKAILLANFETSFQGVIDEKMIQFQLTRKEFEGDITLVVFPFSKLMKSSPVEAANRIGELLKDKIAEIESFNVVQGFLNLVIAPVYWLKELSQMHQAEKFGFETANSKPTIMVEYSSPNTNKPLHLGHLRNNFLGYAVAEIYKANGHKVVKTQIINDRGIHICKSMLAWERFSPVNKLGERETPENTGLKGDKLVGKYYVEFDKNLNIQAKEVIAKWENNAFDGFSDTAIAEFQKFTAAKVDKDEKAIATLDDKIKELAKNETVLMKDVKQMLVRWEARDPETIALWKMMNGWVYDGFGVTYEKMQVDFDTLYYESDTYLLGKNLIEEGLEKGIFFKKEDHSVWVDLTADGLDEKLLLRGDGTSVYMTQDIGTAIERFKAFPDMEGMVYTVGNEQDYHFKVLFLILQKMGYSWAENCYHLSYGMVDLPSGKMKSREGTVVDADDLIDEVVEKAREMTNERGHIEGMTEEQKEQLFKQIGLGGLKYYLLKVDPKKRMMFNPEESIELTGNTGPFIQYAHARIHSLVARAESIGSFEGATLGAEEKEIIKLLSQYPAVIQEAAKELSPALIANFVYELVKAFNHFYQAVPIHIEENLANKNLRLIICINVAKVINSGMSLLGIEVPEKM